MRIVVARYNEDVSCFSFFLDHCLIYNKGSEMDMQCIPLPNIGREAHTYLHHIIENYDNLDDITVFTQGNPLDHSAKFFNRVEDLLINRMPGHFVNLCDQVIDIHGLRCAHWPYGTLPDVLPVTAKTLLDPEFQKSIWFGAGAIFAVSKEGIQQRSLKFYQKAISLFPTTPFCGGYSYAFERLWPVIFNAS